MEFIHIVPSTEWALDMHKSDLLLGMPMIYDLKSRLYLERLSLILNPAQNKWKVNIF